MFSFSTELTLLKKRPISDINVAHCSSCKNTLDGELDYILQTIPVLNPISRSLRALLEKNKCEVLKEKLDLKALLNGRMLKRFRNMVPLDVAIESGDEMSQYTSERFLSDTSKCIISSESSPEHKVKIHRFFCAKTGYAANIRTVF